MSIEKEFLHDICANPDDLTPRLVYADWLDERGGKGDPERAEFIRLQCRLASPNGIDNHERESLKSREKALLIDWGKVWYKPFRGMFARYEYRRGFIERVTMKARAFIDWGESLLNRTPLRIVKLRDPKEHVAALADTRALERLEGLNLNFGKLGQTRSVAFLASPYLSNLRWLDLGNNSITQVGVEALCKAHPRLTNLRYLALDDDIVRPFGVGLLSHSPLLGQLEALNLDSNELDDEALRSLSQATRASQLVQLHLSRNSGITAGGLHELLASPNLASLRMVDANCCTLNHNALNQLRKAFGHRIEIDIMNWNARLGDGPVGKS